MAKACPISKQNTCQSKTSGGHPGTILSVGKGLCAKKIKMSDDLDKERVFYEQVWQQSSFLLPLRPIIPKWKGTCTYNDNLYAVIENLKAGMVEPVELDIKIGQSTASYRELLDKAPAVNAQIKKLRHKVLDRITTSHKLGFRIEASSFWRQSKMKLMKTDPVSVLQTYFATRPAVMKAVHRKLVKLLQVVQKHREHLYLVGSSILIIYDKTGTSKKVVVKMLDFAHSEVGTISKTSSQHTKTMDRYIEGLETLIGLLQ